MTAPDQDKVLRRIQGLLDKAAADPKTAEGKVEAEAAMQRATELLAKYGIDMAMLASNKAIDDPIEQKEFTVQEPYGYRRGNLLNGIGLALRVKVIQLGGTRVYKAVGYRSDLERLTMLFASLQIQAIRQMNRIDAKQEYGSYATAALTRSLRTGFWSGFTKIVSDRLREAEGVAANEAGTGTDLVLWDRSNAVDAKYAELFPNARKKKSARVNKVGHEHGQRAGHTADIGLKQFDTNRNQLAR